jgi:hypothetical protein
MLKLALSGTAAAIAGYPVKGAEVVPHPSPLPIPAGKPIVIKSVEFVKYQRPQTGWAGWPRDKGKPFPFVACRIVAENGSFGLADRPYVDWRGKDLPIYAEATRKKLLGQDARKVEELHDRLGGPLQNLTDRALWDLIARDAGKPLHAVFGTKREKIPAYYSKGHLNGLASQKCGYRVWKIHAWPQVIDKQSKHHGTQSMPENASMKTHEPPLSPPERCIEFFRQAREALGDDFTILADCHYHYVDPKKHVPWTIEDAVKLGKGLKELNIFWLEGLPWVAKRPDLYQALKKEVPGLRLQQEFPNTMRDVPAVMKGMREHPEWIDQQSADPNLMTFTAQLHFARWCIENGKLFDSHWPDRTSLQLAAAMTDEQYPFFETATEYHDDIQVVDGMVHAPTEPGLMPIRFPTERGKFQIVDWEHIQQHKLDD